MTLYHLSMDGACAFGMGPQYKMKYLELTRKLFKILLSCKRFACCKSSYEIMRLKSYRKKNNYTSLPCEDLRTYN